MQERHHYFSGLDSERRVGYCRAVRVGHQVWVSGSTALESGGGVLEARRDNAFEQASEAFRRIAAALEGFELGLANVVVVRAYLTEARHIEGYLRAHQIHLGSVCPAATLVGTPFLAHTDLVVEIEVEALD